MGQDQDVQEMHQNGQIPDLHGQRHQEEIGGKLWALGKTRGYDGTARERIVAHGHATFARRHGHDIEQTKPMRWATIFVFCKK